MARLPIPPIDRLLPRVSEDPATGCWNWPGATNGVGYGHIGFKPADGPKTMVLTHRVTYEHFTGPIPEGLVVDHLCRNTLCCNPAHLEAVPQSLNARRGVGFVATNAVKTHCPQGHAYTPENTYVSRRGNSEMRHCRACHREWDRARAQDPERQRKLAEYRRRSRERKGAS